MKTELNDNKYNFWNLMIQIATSILTVGTIIIAVATYQSNKKAELAQKEKDYRKELSNRQLNYYSEISQTMGELLNTMSNPDSLFTSTYYRRRGKFEILYYGKMNLIESKDVDNRLQRFQTLLEEYELDDSGLNIHDLRLAAFDVDEAFRKSIRKTFNVKDDDLTKN
jgi:hypothetical protein